MLSGAAMLQIFEEGRALHPVDRGLLLLAWGHPEIAHHELAALTIGRRDEGLLRWRVLHFGDRLDARAQCPRCEAWAELQMSCAALLEGSAPEPRPMPLQVGTTELTLQVPDSHDLAAIATSQSLDEARAILLERCVGGDVEPSRLSEADRISIAEAIVAADPHAEKLVALSCPNCRHEWDVLFDIVSYVWTEIATEARRVLHEVDVLARTYGWGEAAILGLSPGRRQLYVEMALS